MEKLWYVRDEHCTDFAHGGRYGEIHGLSTRSPAPELVLLCCTLLFFAHRFSFEVDFVSVVDQTVEDGVGQSGIADHLMPMFDRQLAGDQGRARPMAIV